MTDEIKELDLESLYATYTSDEQIKESYERRTVPTGRYTFEEWATSSTSRRSMR